MFKEETYEWDGISAIDNTKIRKIKIQEGVTDIDPRLLAKCTRLTEVEIPSSVIRIRSGYDVKDEGVAHYGGSDFTHEVTSEERMVDFKRLKKITFHDTSADPYLVNFSKTKEMIREGFGLKGVFGNNCEIIRVQDVPNFSLKKANKITENIMRGTNNGNPKQKPTAPRL